jgi:hypothetical protein
MAAAIEFIRRESSIMKKQIFVGAAMVAALVSLYACSSSTTPTTGSSGSSGTIPSDEAGGHTSPYPSCNEITHACHAFDVGEGPIHDCHELGHAAKSDEPCAAQKAHCLSLCVTDGGVDAGNDADAGDAGHAH